MPAQCRRCEKIGGCTVCICSSGYGRFVFHLGEGYPPVISSRVSVGIIVPDLVVFGVDVRRSSISSCDVPKNSLWINAWQKFDVLHTSHFRDWCQVSVCKVYTSHLCIVFCFSPGLKYTFSELTVKNAYDILGHEECASKCGGPKTCERHALA